MCKTKLLDPELCAGTYCLEKIHIKMFTKEEVALRENVSIPVPVRLQKMIYETLTTQMS